MACVWGANGIMYALMLCPCHMKRSIRLILIFLASAFAANSFGSTITAVSNSSSDVQNAINQAANGDTVVVPQGSVTWSSTVKITKGITLVGGGNTPNNFTTVTQGGGGQSGDFVGQCFWRFLHGQKLYMERIISGQRDGQFY